MQQNNEVKSTTNNTKLDLNEIYKVCENFGISKEIISLFAFFERRIRDEQNNPSS